MNPEGSANRRPLFVSGGAALVQGARFRRLRRCRAHFDPTMKCFSPERIGSMWQRLTAAHGELIGWQLLINGIRAKGSSVE